MSNGQLLILVHVAITYWLPCLANLWFRGEIQSSYVIEELTTSTIVTLLLVPALAVIFLRIAERITAPSRRQEPHTQVRLWIERYQRIRPTLAIVTFSIGVYVTTTGQSNYRYSSTEMSQSSSIALLVGLTLNAVAAADLFACMFVAPRLGHETRPQALGTWLFALNSVISASGVAALFQGLLFLTYAAAPRLFERITISKPQSRTLKAVQTSAVAAVIVTALFAVAWLGGQVIKGTSSQDVGDATAGTRDNVTNEYFVRDFVPYLAERLSIHYYSLLYTAADPGLRDPAEGNAVLYPLSTLAFRLDYVLSSPLGISRPEISSVSQLNYLKLSHLARGSREGSSPGAIASFRYVAPAPFDALLCAAYLALVGLWITRISAPTRYSLPGLILLGETMRGLFQSPLDLIIIVDEGVFYLLLAILYASAVKQCERIAVAYVPAVRRRPLAGAATIVSISEASR